MSWIISAFTDCFSKQNASTPAPPPLKLFHTWKIDSNTVELYEPQNGVATAKVINSNLIDRIPIQIPVLWRFEMADLIDQHIPRIEPNRIEWAKKEVTLQQWKVDGFWIKFAQYKQESYLTKTEGSTTYITYNCFPWGHTPISWDNTTPSPIATDEKPIGERNVGAYKMSLAVRNNEIMWQFCNPKLKSTSWIPVDPKLFSWLEQKVRIAAISAMRITEIKLIDEKEIVQVDLKSFKTIKCNYDLGQRIDDKTWFATIIVTKREHLPSGKCGHAGIHIEGLDFEHPISFTCHFIAGDTPQVEAQVSYAFRLKEDEPRPHVRRSNPIPIESGKAREMIIHVINESKRTDLSFSIRGISAATKKPSHNCTTWIKTLLKTYTTIEIKDHFWEKFFTFPSTYAPIKN